MILKLKMVTRLCNLLLLIFFIVSHVNSQSVTNQFLKSEHNNFIVSYASSCPESVEFVVEHATRIWSQYVYSNTPIVLHVSWQSLPLSVNAFSRPTFVKQNVSELPLLDISFPIALAEKLANTNYNHDAPDIELVINSEVPWNFDYTTYPVINKRDLTTIVLHELAHGLGFLGNISMKDSVVSIDNYPLVYDSFIVYDDTTSYISLHTNPLVSQDSLQTISTSNSIYWNGPYAHAFLGYKPQLYAPYPYNPGSSFYHFNDGVVPTGDSLALMKRSFGNNDILHHPDIATLAVLADIGWTDYFIQHIRMPNVSAVGNPIPYKLMFNDDYIDTSFVRLLYSYDGGKNYTSNQIFFNQDSLCFLDSFPSFPFERAIDYAFQTRSVLGDTIIFPPFFPKNTYSFFVGADSESPVILHNPPTHVTVGSDVLRLRADFSDDFGIDSSYIQILIGRNDFSSILANFNRAFQRDLYAFYVDIPLSDYDVVESDQLAYNIFSIDVHGNKSSFVPVGEFQFLTLEANRKPLHYFVTDFEADSILDYFYFDKFSIGLELGFENKALHTHHPYASSFIDRQYLQYSAQLKNPIIIAANPALMEFDQVVLVEPSEAGVDFGMYGFWDYVVVEGTKNTSSGEWKPLGKKGYDSRLYSDWLSSYFSLLTPDNNNSSTAMGTKEMYKKYSINLLENKYFREGDTVFIRFRLQSDFNRHGWGWAIDNLSIQQKSMKVPEITDRVQNVLYPNPLTSKMCVKQNLDIRSITILNTSGIVTLQFNSVNSNCLDVSNLSTGVYYVVVETATGTIVEKVIKVDL